MKHLSVAILTAALLMALTVSEAKADFVLVDSQRPETKPAIVPVKKTVVETVQKIEVVTPQSTVTTTTVGSSHAPGVLMVGTPEPSPKLEGWGNQVPLSLALKQVVPANWAVDFSGLDENKIVSWSGDKPWPAVLSRIGSVYGFASKIDWTQKKVSVYSVDNTPAVVVAKTVVEAPKTVLEAPVVVTTTETKTVVEAPVVVRKEVETVSTVVRKEVEQAPVVVAPVVVKAEAVGPKMHSLIPGRSLRENIEIWAQEEGWTVVWEGADYPVVAKASFAGRFDEIGGPIDTVISAYDSSEQPLLAKVTLRDRVIKVTNRNYNAASVLPSSPDQEAPNAFRR